MHSIDIENMWVRVLSFIIIVGFTVGANAETPKSLFGIPIAWRQANTKAEIRLNTLISVPWQNGKSFVLIRVPRANLSEAFERGVFEAAKDSGQGLAHPLLLPGIELVLKPTWLDITVHEGTILHLRADVPGDRSYQTFRKRSAVGTIETVSGAAFITTDPSAVAKSFDDIYVAWHGDSLPSDANWERQPDGSLIYRSSGGGERRIPSRYPPRMDR
jgi:hypothetical protein